MFKKIGLALLSVIFVVSMVHASPVEIIGVKKDSGFLKTDTEGETLFGGKLLLNIGALYDGVIERKLNNDNGKVEFNTAAGEVALEYDKMIKGYVTLGQAFDIKYKFQDGSDDVRINEANNFIWGVGSAMRFPQLKVVDIIADVNYRQSSNIDYDSVDVNGTNYSKSSVIGIKSKWQEWGASLGVIKDLGMLSPYVGVRYSTVKTSSKVTVASTTYDLGNAKSDKNVGVFVGTLFNPIKDIDINVQGRFIDETAVSVSAAWKF